MGVAGGLQRRKREQVARLLGIALLVVVSAAERYRVALGYRSRGAAITTVLVEVEKQDRLADRLLVAGKGDVGPSSPS